MYKTWMLAIALVTVLQLFATVSAQADTENPGGLYGGDIMLTREQWQSLEATANPNDPFSPQQAVVRNQRSLWPNAVVPYIIDSSLGKLFESRFTKVECICMPIYNAKLHGINLTLIS